MLKCRYLLGEDSDLKANWRFWSGSHPRENVWNGWAMLAITPKVDLTKLGEQGRDFCKGHRASDQHCPDSIRMDLLQHPAPMQHHGSLRSLVLLYLCLLYGMPAVLVVCMRFRAVLLLR